jgi:hypothetical protein
MASGTLILPLVLAVVLVSFVIAALLAYRSVRQRRDRLAKQRELEQYENALQMDRAQRALQRAREVLAERTGNAGWNPQLEQRVRSMQLETKTAPSLGDDSTGGLVSPSGDPVKVSERAMQLVIEYGAQGAMMQVMHAAKKQLDKEMRELEASERFPGSELEEDSEDPVWRTRVKDQMQLKELEKQLAAVDEETQDMLSECVTGCVILSLQCDSLVWLPQRGAPPATPIGGVGPGRAGQHRDFPRDWSQHCCEEAATSTAQACGMGQDVGVTAPTCCVRRVGPALCAGRALGSKLLLSVACDGCGG